MDRRESSTDEVRSLFEDFASGALDRFLAGCASDLVLTVRGSGTRTTLVAKSGIASWYRSMHDLTGGTFRSEVFLQVAEDHTEVVLLRHTLIRGRVEYRYETVNRCTWGPDGLASWFSHPLRPADYARAWGIPPTPARVSA